MRDADVELLEDRGQRAESDPWLAGFVAGALGAIGHHN